jgi:hypothetical protein
MRNRSTLWPRPVTYVVALALGTLAGCGSDELNSPTAVRMRGLANLYLDCAVPKNGKGPANEQEFKKHIRGLPEFVITGNKLDPKALDAAFVSERDQEPIVLRYGLTIKQISATSAPLIAHEKTGKNGKRLVAFANGKVDLVTEAQLQELTENKP